MLEIVQIDYKLIDYASEDLFYSDVFLMQCLAINPLVFNHFPHTFQEIDHIDRIIAINPFLICMLRNTDINDIELIKKVLFSDIGIL